MKHVFLSILVGYFAGFSGCTKSGIKRNQISNEASKQIPSDPSDPVSFVEVWVADNLDVLEVRTFETSHPTVERILYDGKIYESVVSIGDESKASFLIRFRKENAKWIFLSQKKIALDYGWPSR